MYKLVRKDVKVTQGKEEKSFVNFFVVLENGNRIQVKPAFKDDFTKLLLIAERE